MISEGLASFLLMVVSGLGLVWLAAFLLSKRVSGWRAARKRHRLRKGFVVTVAKLPQEPVGNGRRPLAAVWLPAILKDLNEGRMAHLLLVGESRSGKSTVGRALVWQTPLAGMAVSLIDPHNKPADYPGVSVVGAGRNFAAINAEFEALLAEFDRRFASPDHDHFWPVLIVIDEWNAILYSGQVPAAARFINTFLREAAKIHMHLVLLVQSPNVEDLGANAASRRSASRLFIGSFARTNLPAEFGPSERYALVLEYALGKLALGSQDLPVVAQKHSQPSVWLPYAPVKLVVAAPPEIEKELGKELEIESEEPVKAGVEDYIRVTAWLVKEPDLSNREVARRLYDGKDNGRFAMKAGAIMKQVRGVTVTAGAEKTPITLETPV